MKRFLIVVLVVLAACTVHIKEIDKAIEVCEPNGGLLSITEGDRVLCGNGARFYL